MIGLMEVELVLVALLRELEALVWLASMVLGRVRHAAVHKSQELAEGGIVVHTADHHEWLQEVVLHILQALDALALVPFLSSKLRLLPASAFPCMPGYLRARRNLQVLRMKARLV